MVAEQHLQKRTAREAPLGLDWELPSHCSHHLLWRTAQYLVTSLE